MESRLEEHRHLNRQSSSQPGVILLFQGILAMFGDTFEVVTGRGRRILLFSGWRLGRLLNMLLCWPQSSFGFFRMLEWKTRMIFLASPIQCIGQSPTTKNDLV